MTFLEAALELLYRTGRPLHVKELTDRAIRQNLLSHVGRTPEQTMQAKLAEEVKKGGVLVRVTGKPGVFGLKTYQRPKVDMPNPSETADNGEGKRRRRRRGGRGGRREAEADLAVEAGTPEEALVAEELAAEAETSLAEDVDYDALAKEYEGELEGVGTAPVEGEVVDEKTADEDRPMLEPIEAERGRRGRGRGRAEAGRRGRDRGKKKEAAPPARPPRAAPLVRPSPPPPSAPAPVSSSPTPTPTPASSSTPSPTPSPTPTQSLADIAFGLLKSLNDPRPVHARQLAAMAMKRKLASGEGEELWRQMQLALLDDVRARHGRGLRPRVRHQGGGLFAIATQRLDETLARAEQAVVERLEALQGETRAALERRLRALDPQAFERLARLFLDRAGARQIERVKEVDKTAYLATLVPRGSVSRRVLVGARAGGDEAGRRAVGELRTGVLAKQLDEGWLLLAGRLGADAERELAAAGPPLHVLDGAAFAAALIEAGVAVVKNHIPVIYLDADFLSELGEPPPRAAEKR